MTAMPRLSAVRCVVFRRLPLHAGDAPFVDDPLLRNAAFRHVARRRLAAAVKSPSSRRSRVPTTRCSDRPSSRCLVLVPAQCTVGRATPQPRLDGVAVAGVGDRLVALDGDLQRDRAVGGGHLADVIGLRRERRWRRGGWRGRWSRRRRGGRRRGGRVSGTPAAPVSLEMLTSNMPTPSTATAPRVTNGPRIFICPSWLLSKHLWRCFVCTTGDAGRRFSPMFSKCGEVLISAPYLVAISTRGL